MKHIAFGLLLAALPALARADDVAATIKREAESCAKAHLAYDYDGIVKYTHPRVLALMGGKEAMVGLLKRGTAQLRAQGVELADATIGTPDEPRKIGAWLTCLVPQHLVMKASGSHILHDSVLLGISEDEGKNWVFLDLGPVSEARFAQLFPELQGKISLPEKKPPVVKDD